MVWRSLLFNFSISSAIDFCVPQLEFNLYVVGAVHLLSVGRDAMCLQTNSLSAWAPDESPGNAAKSFTLILCGGSSVSSAERNGPFFFTYDLRLVVFNYNTVVPRPRTSSAPRRKTDLERCVVSRSTSLNVIVDVSCLLITSFLSVCHKSLQFPSQQSAWTFGTIN